MEPPITEEQPSDNVLGVMHTLKSVLMVVNDGYIDMLESEKSSDLYEYAKNAASDMETIINNIVFALHALQDAEPTELSSNQCVRSAVGLIRSNKTF